MTPTCSDCGKGITAHSKTGRCRVCALRATCADPIAHERKVAAIRERAKDPDWLRKARVNLYVAHMRARRNPATAERMNKGLVPARARLNDPDVAQRLQDSRAEAGRKRHATVMAWCPEEYRAEYTMLVRSRKMRAAEAKRFILSKLSPFERQMLAIKNGRGIVTRPNLSKSYDYTLAGGSPL